MNEQREGCMDVRRMDRMVRWANWFDRWMMDGRIDMMEEIEGCKQE